MPSPVNRQGFHAVLFDLDGVLTTTRTVHGAAWKHTFDAFLGTLDARHGGSSILTGQSEVGPVRRVWTRAARGSLILAVFRSSERRAAGRG